MKRPAPFDPRLGLSVAEEPPLPYPEMEYGVLQIDGQTLRTSEMRMQRSIGNGNFGYVYRVDHPALGISAAVKKIPDKSREEARKRMLMDLEINKRADSDFVVKFYGFDFVAGELQIFMELMRCSLEEVYSKVLANQKRELARVKAQLDTLLAQLPQDEGHAAELQQQQQSLVEHQHRVMWEEVVPEEVLQMFAYAVLQGLLYLKESLGVLHQDVKPSNVLLGFDGSVKLCDFGVCTKTQGSLAHTVLGCKMYFAPEKIDIGGAIDSRTDVWSMGITLLEIALLRFPLPPLAPFELLEFIRNQEPLPSAPEMYSDHCRDFLGKCLRYNVQERPKIYAPPVSFPHEEALRDHPFVTGPILSPAQVAAWYQGVLECAEAAEAHEASAAAMTDQMDPFMFLLQQQHLQQQQQQQVHPGLFFSP